MRRKGIIGALLAVGVGVVLGGTVLRDQVASAAARAQSVFISNTSDSPVPVIPVGVTRSPTADLVIPAGDVATSGMGLTDASIVTVSGWQGIGQVFVGTATGPDLRVRPSAGETIVWPLPQPMPVDQVLIACSAASPTACSALVNVVGR